MRRGGVWPLAVGVAALWVVVWLITQTVPSPALSIGPTVVIGVLLTEVLTFGYWSALRGPRRRGRSRAAVLEPGADQALVEVSRTLPYLRTGLAGGTADQAAKALLPLSGAERVVITDTDKVLGQAGSGRGLDVAALAELPWAVRSAIDRAETVAIDGGTGHAQVAAPMVIDGEVVGTLHGVVSGFDHTTIERFEGLAGLVSVHLELAHLTQKSQLAADAKLDALRAQINPHFLFNTLNTIANKSRSEPETTRQLLQKLAEFFRYTIRQDGHFAEFANEYYFVRTYLALEQARFGDRLSVHYDIDPQVLSAQIPVLTIQPLVENAVKHGLARSPDGGTVWLKARVEPLAGATRISVRDDGVGMDESTLAGVLEGTYRSPSGGVGLANISERLQSLFGERYRFDIRSAEGDGTRIDLELPFR